MIIINNIIDIFMKEKFYYLILHFIYLFINGLKICTYIRMCV